jgi:Tfp pilus assembly protein PilF
MRWMLAALALPAMALALAVGPGPIRFEEIGEKAGARVRHHTRTFKGPQADVLGMFTSGGATVAVGDYDNDGDDDLFVTRSDTGNPNVLLKNRFRETGQLAFEDAAPRAGVAGGNDPRSIVADGLWMDADNDGWRDLLVSRFGTPILYRNLGNGTFRDVSAAAGLTKFGNTIAAIAFDYDNDGRLDLLFGNYFKPVDLTDLPTPHVLPNDLDNAANGGGVTLWQNVTAPGSKEVRFMEVTEKAGLSHHTGWTLDAGHADLNNDGFQEVYLAGDYGTDRLFWNNRDGTFRDGTKEAVGFDTKKGMNVDMGDYDRDGWLDVYVTNITDEYMKECNMLWHNQGDGTFTDLSKETGTCNTLWGWGAKFGDFDNDGWEDLFAVNGLRSAGPENYIPVLLEMIITPNVDFTDLRNWPAIRDRSWSGYQKKKLFRNLGAQTFKEVSAEAGVDNDLDGRGIGLSDFDDDGRLDLYQTNANQASLLYRNTTEPAGRWIELKLIGTKSNRDAIGARAIVRLGGETLIREVNGGNGYAGQSTARLHFGLGAAPKVDSVEIRWPSGLVEKVTVALDRITTVKEGAPRPALTPGPSPTTPPPSLGEEGRGGEGLWHHRNLGKAFYENPTTQYEAVEEFRKALELAPGSARERINYALALLKAGKTAEGVAELQKAQKQDPAIPHTWFNLGIAFKRESRYEPAIAQLEKMVALVPDEAVSHYNLGALYRLTNKPELSLKHFEEAARLAPHLAGPHFQLYNAYKTAGRDEESKRQLATFQEIRKRQEGATVPEDLEWGWYSEIYDEPEPAAPASPAAAPKWERRALASGLDPATAALTVLDADGDHRPDLLAISAAGAALFPDGAGPAVAGGLEGLKGVMAAVPGDFDNDGLADLAVVAGGSAALWHNASGRFEKAATRLPAGSFRTAAWLDFDHDYDLDLFLLGDSAILLRNEGKDGFRDETARFPFVSGKALAAALLHVQSDTQALDLAVVYADRPGVVYRDRLGGSYEAETVAALPAGSVPLQAVDADADGWTDLAAGSALLFNQKARGWKAEKAAVPPPFVLADLDNRGAVSFVTAPEGFAAVALAEADFDGDGRTDVAAVGKDGSLVLFKNAVETPHGWIAVSLEGVKNLNLAPGAEVEVKAGRIYRKRLYQGAPLTFGLGGRSEADAVRITWPNGLIQNETKQAPGRLAAYKEAPRLSGSCPMIFTWNGERFEFITDVLGVAPLGASAGDGQYFPVDHDEFIQIPGKSLVEKDGAYEIRITEELREVAYLDEIRLLAVDHPAVVDVFTNDKFKGPPFPEFHLFGTERKVRPVAARDSEGRDVLDRLLARDRRYPDGFPRNSAGVAGMHALELDFGRAASDGRAVLVLSGWVDWADGSTFLGTAQEDGGGLVLPRLQVRDAAGRWVTVDEDMGIPAGKPKTIVVDLTGKFLSASREVRIETNLCVYWDEIFLSEETGEPPVTLTELPPATARLRFRGFSRPVIHPERKQPESFDYQTSMPVSMWNPTSGLYTRYGDVRPLLETVDDRMVILGSGDEIRLLFDARALPALPDGWTRDFLLKVDGWAKDGDANTAFSQTVEPLPFHGMSQYPYPEGERFPETERHRLYREHYNTRPALRLLRPLEEEQPRGPTE